MRKSKGRECVVPLCESRINVTLSVSFHEFPSTSSLREVWLKNISRGVPGQPSKPWAPQDDKAVVCSLHFIESDFRQGLKRKLLKPGVVPTVFPYPKYKKVVPPLPRRSPKKRLCASNDENCTPLKTVKLSDDSVSENLRRSKAITMTQAIENNKVMLQVNSPEITCEPSSIIAKPKVNKMKSKVNGNWRKRQSSYCKKIQRLSNQVKELKSQVEALQHSMKQPRYMKYQKLKSQDSVKSGILLEQIDSFGKKAHRWSELSLRMFVYLFYKSPKAYRAAVSADIFSLPSVTTLRKYLGPSTLSQGFTPLIQARLDEEIKLLNKSDIYSSLQFDEMSLKPRVQFVKQVKRVVGVAINSERQNVTVANKFLCLLLKGLSTNYRIPVGYYLTKNLQGKELAEFIIKIVTLVERTGFKIIRVVSDDASINVKALSVICGGVLSHRTNHPCDSERPLFVSFDPTHIIKNLRNQLLDKKRNMKNNGKKINGKAIRDLYRLQDGLTVKPVRYLTRSVVFPTNFEKMKVMRALRIFSDDLIAALCTFEKKGLLDTTDCEGTVEFLKIMKKWFEIHNVCNTTVHKFSRNKDKAPFWVLEDERLTWLETDFLDYLSKWKTSTTLKTEFLTAETFKAISTTTQSTVECIRYLLGKGFHFILTRKLTTDDIEALFSNVRSWQGWNDQTDAVGAIRAVERIVKIGLMSASHNSNVLMIKGESKIFDSNRLVPALDTMIEDVLVISPITKKYAMGIAVSTELQTINVSSAGITMIAGFCVMVVQKKVNCGQADQLLIDPTKEDPINDFLSLQDRGGLRFPSSKFSGFVKSIFDTLDSLGKQVYIITNVVIKLFEFLEPFVDEGQLACGCGDPIHSARIKNIVLGYIIKIFLVNSSNRVCEKVENVKFDNKCLSKKVKKL